MSREMSLQEFRIDCAEKFFPYCDSCRMPAVRSEFFGLRHSTPDHPSGVPSYMDDSDHMVTIRNWNKNPSLQPAIQELMALRKVGASKLRVGDEIRDSDSKDLMYSIFSEFAKLDVGTINDPIPLVYATVLLPDMSYERKYWPADQMVTVWRRSDK